MAVKVKVSFKSNRAGQAKFGNSNAVYRELEHRAQRVVQLAQQLAPVDTGEYKQSFKTERTRIRGKAAVQVVNTSAHAAIVEHGSRAHVIESHGDYPLRSKTGQVFGRRVNHPGTPAMHVLRRALKAAGR